MGPVVVLHNGGHVKVFAEAGTYERAESDWLLAPLAFPTHRVKVKDPKVLAELAAHAAVVDGAITVPRAVAR